MIKNIIFDVGNVLLEYRWLGALCDTGIDEETGKVLGPQIFEIDGLWTAFDAGDISLEDLIEEYGKRFPQYKKYIAEFITKAERMVITRPEVWEKVHILKEKGYGIYLLSNYSDYLFNIHTKGADFLNDLSGRIVSYEVHEVKPYPAIYNILLEKYNLDASECIFLDDRPENIEAGEQLGIKGVIIESREHINNVLQTYIDEGIK